MLMAADTDFEVSVTEVAVTVTIAGAGATAGAVYLMLMSLPDPGPLKVPQAPVPVALQVTVQVTPSLKESLVTTAANSAVVLVRSEVGGVEVVLNTTEIGGAVVVVFLLESLHATSPAASSRAASKVAEFHTANCAFLTNPTHGVAFSTRLPDMESPSTIS
jgi:hypothetical protein